MKLQKAIYDAYQNLKSSNIKSALLDSELLMANVLNETREHIILNLNKDIAKKIMITFRIWLTNDQKENPSHI